MPSRATAVLVVASVLAGCGPSASSVRVTALPAPGGSPVSFAAQSREGKVFAGLFDGSWLTLDAAGTAWVEAPPPAVSGLLVDHQQGLTLGLGAGPTALRASSGGFTTLPTSLPGLDPGTFNGQRALLGRDGQGVFWATAAPTSGTQAGTLLVHRVEPGSPGTWQVESFPISIPRHTIPAGSQGALTAEGRLFYRPLEGGLWEVDRASRTLVERVPCSHPLFRPSHPDYVACQEDTTVFSGRAGELFLLTPTHELWRIPAGSSTPSLAVKGMLPELVLQDVLGFNNYAPGGYRTYVDPADRVWLAFTWGNNSADDTSYLYLADPARSDGWTFLRGDLPRGMVPFGDGLAPLLATGVVGATPALMRVE